MVTGVIINSEGKATIKNALRKKIMVEYEYLRNNPDDVKSRQRLRGLVTAARQVDKSAYPNIRKFAFENSREALIKAHYNRVCRGNQRQQAKDEAILGGK